MPDQYLGHAGPSGFQRGHVSHADGGGQRGDGAGRGEGRRGADEKAVQGLQGAPHPDFHVCQQAGPFRQGADRFDGRAGKRVGHPFLPDELACRV